MIGISAGSNASSNGGTSGPTLATGEIFEVVYRELHALARERMRHERRDHTLQPTALVHEVYLKLATERGGSWTGRAQFFAAASQAIRRILVNHAKARASDRRGGQYERVCVEDPAGPAGSSSPDLLALDEALERLARLDPRQSRIVELRYFAGLLIDEVADLIGLSARTVDGEWALARAWLRGEISGREGA